MFKLFSTVVVAAALTGCTLTASQQNAFDKACSGLRGAYAVFNEVKELASGSQVRLVDATFGNVNSFCVNPPADQTEAAVRVAGASLTIWKVYRSVK